MIRSPLACAFLLVTLAGCIHQGARQSDAAPEEPLPDPSELALQDPDPEKDQELPQVCNTTGKHGAELKQCLAHNEAYYKEFADEAKQREPWFNFTPDSWVASKELEPQYVLPVVKLDEAVEKLDAAPLVELSQDEVRYFTGKPATYPGLRPYLVRGLMDADQGGFSVFEKDHAIFVRHDSLGATASAEKRTALVVFLDFKPKDVYVDCQSSE